MSTQSAGSLRAILAIAELLTCVLLLFGQNTGGLRTAREAVQAFQPPGPGTYLARYWSGMAHVCPAGRVEPSGLPSLVERYCGPPVDHWQDYLAYPYRAFHAAFHAATGHATGGVKLWLGFVTAGLGALLMWGLMTWIGEENLSYPLVLVVLVLAFAGAGVFAWLVAGVVRLFASVADGLAGVVALVVVPMTVLDRLVAIIAKYRSMRDELRPASAAR